MRVLIQQPRLPHYRVPLFERLARKHQWDLTVVYSSHTTSNESGIEVEIAASFRRLNLPQKTYTLAGVQTKFQPGLMRLLRAAAWDAVFLEGAQSNLSGYLAALWCRRRRVPCIWWTKGYFEPQNALRRMLHRVQLKAPHAFLPYGDSTHEFLRQYGVSQERIVQAYNTVDVEDKHRRIEFLREMGRCMLQSVFGEQVPRPLIAYVGRLTAGKRVEDAIRALHCLASGKGVRATLWVVGDGSLRRNLEHLAHTLGLSQQVAFAGRVPLDGDAAALSVSDVSVFPGDHGLAINLSMALGTPVVASDSPGPDGEMVTHGETGWRFPVGDTTALAGAVLDALHASNRDAIVQRAQQEILSRRSLSRYAEAFQEAARVARNVCCGQAM
jgi:glycosyltransferase involved in cell wall biosynthesis